jgi:UDP-N-acetylmuramyl pentapeptide phosphotransferase/UDP-N-acetylglucosamine-1-phosphate transferase
MIDDIMAMAVLPRLAAQVAVIAVVIAALPSDLSIVPWLPWWIERVLLLVAILWFVNLVNFMDGIDWMMVTEVVPITVALVVAGYLGALPLHATIVAATLLGAMIGFAPFNKPVARLFLGDVGSLPIGLLLGYLLVLLATRGHLAATLLLPLYFLADASITLVRRVWRRERFWKPHRAHFYQRALDNGMPIGAILISVFTTNLVLAVLAIVTVLNDVRTVDIVCLVTGGIFVAGLLLRLSRSHA